MIKWGRNRAYTNNFVDKINIYIVSFPTRSSPRPRHMNGIEKIAWLVYALSRNSREKGSNIPIKITYYVVEVSC